MTQLRNHWVDPEAMIRSRAWREGYEAFRLGAPLEYMGPRSKALAYEYGRLTAAHLKSQGAHLNRVSPHRPFNAHYLPELTEALLAAVVPRQS